MYKDDKKRCVGCLLRKNVGPGQTRELEMEGCLGGKTLHITHTGMAYEGKKAILEIFQDVTESRKADKAIREAKESCEKNAMGLKKTNGLLNILYEELERKNEKLLEVDRLKSEFVSMASHELRTPLAAIKESVAIVAEGAAGGLGDEQKDFLETAQRNIERLMRLINGILVFQKLESRKVDFRIRIGNINKTIEEAVKTMMPSIKAKGLKLTMILAKDAPDMPFDSDQMTQVLSNLISNAIKFTDQGSIAVSSSMRSRNAICVSVTDTGIGIKNDDLDRLFESFSQVTTEDGQRAKGTGLGLAISKRIIDGHRGKIMVRSEYGKGSAFSIILPVEERRG